MRLIVALALASALRSQGLDCSGCHQQSQPIASTPHAVVGCANCHPRHDVYPHPTGASPKQCTECHADAGERIRRSRHAEVMADASACSLCHGDPHQVKPTQAAEFVQAVPELCGTCHDNALAEYTGSVHGAAVSRGIVSAPVCTTCHRGHDVQSFTRSTPQGLTRVPEVCANCHGDVQLTSRFGLRSQVVASFESSFHGLALKGGSQTVASCASCHGAHKTLPSSNPESTVHPANLARTCGQCHPGAGSRFAIGQIHWVEGRSEPVAVSWVRISYQVLIPLIVGLMAVYCFGDWLRKAVELRFSESGGAAAAALPARPRVKKDAAHFRMYRGERIQHGLLIISFTVLVWSGFALRYPEQWWARPLVAWEQNGQFRGMVHRTAGACLIAVALLHVISLIVNPELRKHWKGLWPNRRDVTEGFARFAYNLRLRKQRPPISSHSYIEKAEYWAVVWGTALMAISGIMLWVHNFLLAHAPKVVLDIAAAIHLYEAVLATLAIVVWHFYMVIFDPEVYPVDSAWLTGYSPRDRDEH